MFQFFTAKVGKVIVVQVPVGGADDKDPDDEKPQGNEKPLVKPKGEKEPVAFVELDLADQQQDSKPAVLSTLVQGISTQGKSSGQLLPFKDGVTAHMMLDLAFVRRLKPGMLLRVEWETRTGGIMGNVLAVARLQ